MMREVLTRRFARLMKENPRAAAAAPSSPVLPGRAAAFPRHPRRAAGAGRGSRGRRRTVWIPFPAGCAGRRGWREGEASAGCRRGRRSNGAGRRRAHRPLRDAGLAGPGADRRRAGTTRRRARRARRTRRPRRAIGGASPRGRTATRGARPSSSRPRALQARSARPALYFVQRLRDEAHRFAIGTHRAKRKREFTKSPLDEIPGSAPPASARCCCTSAPPRPSPALPSTTWPARRASTWRRRRPSTPSSMRGGIG